MSDTNPRSIEEKVLRAAMNGHWEEVEQLMETMIRREIRDMRSTMKEIDKIAKKRLDLKEVSL